MAKVSGNPKISGAFGEAVFVQIDGQTYIRGRAKTSKEVIHTAPSREGQRQTMSEFGKSSQCAKVIREAWRIGEQSAAGPGTSGRLTKVIQQIMDCQPGKKGGRSVLLTQFGHKLIGFEHDSGRSPIPHFNQLPLISQSHDGRTLTVSLELPPNTRHIRKKAHPKATYYAMELSVVILTDMHTTEDKKRLEFAGGQFWPEVRNISSKKIHIGKNPGAEGSITTTIPLWIHPGKIALISWGVQYYTCQGGIDHCIRIEKPRSTVPQHDTYMVVHSAHPLVTAPQKEKTETQIPPLPIRTRTDLAACRVLRREEWRTDPVQCKNQAPKAEIGETANDRSRTRRPKAHDLKAKSWRAANRDRHRSWTPPPASGTANAVRARIPATFVPPPNLKWIMRINLFQDVSFIHHPPHTIHNSPSLTINH